MHEKKILAFFVETMIAGTPVGFNILKGKFPTFRVFNCIPLDIIFLNYLFNILFSNLFSERLRSSPSASPMGVSIFYEGSMQNRGGPELFTL